MLPAGLVRGLTRVSSRWSLSPRITVARQRRRSDALFRLPGAPRGTELTTVERGGVPGETLVPPGADRDTVLLYLHGGGYVVGSARAYHGLTGPLAAAMGARAVVPDYRLAPEHPAPAALEDARAVYESLLADGVATDRLVVAGDSAGGNLALVLALALRDAGRPLPAALGLICPWTDVRPEIDRTRPPAPREPILTRGLTSLWAGFYLSGGASAADPLISPVLGDLAGLPPIVLHSCGDDLIASDATALERRAREAGTPVEHTRLAGLWHDVHLTAWMIRGIGDPVSDLGRALARACAP